MRELRAWEKKTGIFQRFGATEMHYTAIDGGRYGADEGEDALFEDAVLQHLQHSFGSRMVVHFWEILHRLTNDLRQM